MNSTNFPTTIGILGAGALGSTLARLLVGQGFKTLIANRRGKETLISLLSQAGPLLNAVSAAEAASAPLVIIAMPWAALSDVLPSLAPWDARVVIDATNPVSYPGGPIEPLNGLSSSRFVASMLPGARVVKAFNHLTPQALQQPMTPAGSRVLFLAGDDEGAKRQVAALIETLRFLPIDLGGLDDGALLTQYPGGPLPGLELIHYRSEIG